MIEDKRDTEAVPPPGLELTQPDPFGGNTTEEGWRYSPKFGTYRTDQYPWIYHSKLGFIYVKPVDEEIFLYVENKQSDKPDWLLTSRTLLPRFYSFSKKSWLTFDGEDSFLDYVELGDGWYENPLLGTFNARDFPWVFHPDLGFVFVKRSGKDLYIEIGQGKTNSLGWIFTNPTIFPSVYSFSKKSWLLYVSGANFYNKTTQVWEFY